MLYHVLWSCTSLVYFTPPKTSYTEEKCQTPSEAVELHVSIWPHCLSQVTHWLCQGSACGVVVDVLDPPACQGNSLSGSKPLWCCAQLALLWHWGLSLLVPQRGPPPSQWLAAFFPTSNCCCSPQGSFSVDLFLSSLLLLQNRNLVSVGSGAFLEFCSYLSALEMTEWMTESLGGGS